MPRLTIKRSPSAQFDPHGDEVKLREAIETKLVYSLGKNTTSANDYDWYQATALALRDRIVDVWLNTENETTRRKKQRVSYLSIEFLSGRLLLDT
ncbi:MAG: glycogen phosphorylase, partial [bacterium]